MNSFDINSFGLGIVFTVVIVLASWLIANYIFNRIEGGKK